ncbi:uncharacterized protein LOC128546927 [Mercenaria mercenaria]|uniref:uncharacterized protein LOC128546927 n=1 Tax=Mercenaria mercenaria TaxID=6596 RepID=UPI00234E3C09|nr:uncharacterized protein LOC128546927 [Mercenaria mercenaria]
MEQEIAALKQINNQFQTKLRAKSKTAGDTYARWGRTTCPGNGTTRLYTGYMAGSHRSHIGTGSNYLCLTNEPLWDHFEESVASLGKITGTEYRFNEHRSNGAADFLGDYMYNQKVPCAICHTQRSVSVMIPGRNRCYDGWTMEYRGYLVSGYTGDTNATEYVSLCLDRRPEKLHDGTTAGTDNRLYFVEGICGKTLTCPPYVSGLEITCVVCSV